MQNDMRDRLIGLISSAGYDYDDFIEESHERGLSVTEDFEEWCADHLIANGVQEVKQATWIINPDGYYPYCSNCNYEPDRPQTHSDNRTPYCPNCGAKMKKEWE